MKHKQIILTVFAITVCSCVHAAESSTNDVLRNFQQQAMVLVASQTNSHLKAFLSGKVQDGAHLSAQPSTFSNCFKRIDGTLSSDERKSLILKGQIADLKRDSACWVVESFGGKGSEVCGYLDWDAKTLVLLWIVPEG